MSDKREREKRENVGKKVEGERVFLKNMRGEI